MENNTVALGTGSMVAGEDQAGIKRGRERAMIPRALLKRPEHLDCRSEVGSGGQKTGKWGTKSIVFGTAHR